MYLSVSFFFRGRFNGSLERSILHDDDGDSYDDDDDKDDGGGSVWLFKHFHHKFAREGTPVSLASTRCLALSLSRRDCSPVPPLFAANHVRAYHTSSCSRLVIRAAKTNCANEKIEKRIITRRTNTAIKSDESSGLRRVGGRGRMRVYEPRRGDKRCRMIYRY